MYNFKDSPLEWVNVSMIAYPYSWRTSFPLASDNHKEKEKKRFLLLCYINLIKKYKLKKKGWVKYVTVLLKQFMCPPCKFGYEV